MKRIDRTTLQRKKKRRWILGAVAILLIGGGVYFTSIYSSFSSAMSDIHEPVGRETSEKRTTEISLEEQDPFSVLLLGVDEREGDGGRSDTMLVATIDPKTESMKMVSIPRDTYTEIIGHGTYDKINHAFSYGGIEMSMNTVENLLDLPIDYVAQINMEGFKDIVDAVDGVNVQNAIAFEQFPEGDIHLNGTQALSYVQMRKQDPRGDFGRQDRQKEVIEGIIAKGASASSLVKYKEIFEALGDNLRTNMTLEEMLNIQRNYRNTVQTIDQLTFDQGTGETIDGIWYYRMNERELTEVTETLKNHLGI